MRHTFKSFLRKAQFRLLLKGFLFLLSVQLCKGFCNCSNFKKSVLLFQPLLNYCNALLLWKKTDLPLMKSINCANGSSKPKFGKSYFQVLIVGKRALTDFFMV